MAIKDNIQEIKSELPDNIIIEAATKKRSLEDIQAAIGAGITVIGENYIQEAEAKYPELKGKVKVHCIGHIQSNKIKKAVEIFDMIETVDSLNIAKEISKRTNKPYPILIEINSAKEPNKDGVMPEDTISLIKQISQLPNIKIKGLMTMGQYQNEKPCFRLTKQLFDKIKNMSIPNIEMKYLSMGMSDSYKAAVEEGANIVRIGTRIFGPRT